MNILKFKQRLLNKERELQSDIARLQEEARAAGQAEVGDPTDAATISEGASDSLQQESLASQTLVEVEDALRRIENGTYGKCAECGREMERARLEAIPWARYCLKDQEKYDRAARVPQGGATL